MTLDLSSDALRKAATSMLHCLLYIAKPTYFWVLIQCNLVLGFNPCWYGENLVLASIVFGNGETLLQGSILFYLLGD